MVTSHSQNHGCPGLYLASVCMCESLCVFKFCSAESLANPLCTSQCPVSEELWPLSSCSPLNPLKKCEGCLNANESVCTKTCPGGHTLGSETQRGRYCTVPVAGSCTQHVHTVAHTHVDWGKTYYAVLGFSWGSNDLAVTTFLLVSESGCFGVWYIRLNGLQVQSCSVNTSVVSSILSVFHILMGWYSLSQIEQLESMRGSYRYLATHSSYI